MPISRRIAFKVGVALLAATALLVPIAPARAGCNLDDVFNAVVNTVESFTSNSCAAACDDEATCAAAVAVTAALFGVATDASQGTVDTFCTDVQKISTGSDDADTVVNTLQASGASIGEDALNGLSSALNGVADPLGATECACSVEQSVGQLGSSFGACLQDFLCAGDELLGDPCTCKPPPPVVANCAQTNAGDCGNFTSTNCAGTNALTCACNGGTPTSPTLISGKDGQTISGYTGVSQKTNSSGTVVIGGGSGSDGKGHCAPTYYCFCPAPMQGVWTPDNVANTNGNPGDSGWYIFSCQCPSTTHPDPSGKTVAGVSVCLCDNSNQPANFSPDSFGGMCPPPACPSGQVRLSGVGNCVTPCSNPSDGMALDGSCCDPSQMTSCGTCCPPGTTPDPVTGSCTPPQTIE